MKNRIALATQGSQGIVAIRELFSLGYRVEDIDIYICKSEFNSPLISFIEYLEYSYTEIGSSSDFDSSIVNYEADSILLSISWKFLISKKIIESFNYRAINFHPGLLPYYKGCFSTPWSLINNEKKVGYTYHFMDETFDSGNIIFSNSIKIKDEDNAFSLNYKILQQGLSFLGNALEKIDSKGMIQEKIGEYYPNKLPLNGELKIEWDEDFALRFIKAMYFPPHRPAFMLLNNKEININSIDDFLRYKNG
jgi:methionyl-tRNA formyltransferase|tara:strand:+ start:365 stop:1114 length:750 start_codon:yes stop_codon:yes gene_type:complete